MNQINGKAQALPTAPSARTWAALALGFTLTAAALGAGTAYATPIEQLYPTDGPDDARVTIVVFSDFQCPFCARVGPTLAKVRAEFPDDVRLVWVHHPLAFHTEAVPAARASMAAFAQGAFWPMHDKLMSNQRQLTRASYVRWARELDVDLRKFVADMGSAAVGDKVARDETIARKLGIRGTPGFLINGMKVAGAQPYTKFRDAVTAELSAWDDAEAAGIDRNDLLLHRVRIHNPSIGDDYAAWLIRGELPPKAKLGNAAEPRKPIPQSNFRVPLGADDGVTGSGAPLVTIVEFTDYQCPFCVRANRTLNTLLPSFGADVQRRTKHNPLSFHRNAMPAAKAAVCAHRQGKFKALHDILFAHPRKLTKSAIASYAKSAGLSMTAFSACWSDPKTEAAVRGHQAEARAVGAGGTPSFVINGRRVTGAQPATKFRQVITEQLAFAKAAIASGKTGRKDFYAWSQRDAVFAKNAPGRKPKFSGPTHAFATAGRPSLGNTRAKDATVVVFGELACPFCTRLLPALQEVVKKRPKLRIAVLHMPLSSQCNSTMTADMHPAACLGATWIEAAHKQGKLGPFLAAVAEHGPLSLPRRPLSRAGKKARKRLDAELLMMAKKARLNLRKARKFVRKADWTQLVAADLAQAKGAEVRGTPTIFIYGRKYSGDRSAAALLSAIDEEKPKPLAQRAAPEP